MDLEMIGFSRLGQRRYKKAAVQEFPDQRSDVGNIIDLPRQDFGRELVNFQGLANCAGPVVYLLSIVVFSWVKIWLVAELED
jgi:hypothetical protein